MSSDRPTVTFTATTGWTIRNFVHTGVFASVHEFAKIAVAASVELAPYFRELRATGAIDEVFELPNGEPSLWKLLRQSKKAILQGKANISTAAIKLRARGGGPLRLRLRSLMWAIQHRLSANWQLAAIEAVERRWAPAARRSLPTGSTLLVNCSPFDPRDNAIQRAASKQGICTLSIIPSWDNPSTKGAILSDVDEILVWGEHQRRELLGYYPRLSKDRVSISGIPQFDAYSHAPTGRLKRAAFLKSMSIDPARRVILYATCSEKLFPNEPHVVGDIVEGLEQGTFGDAHLLVRCHPADRAARYERYAENPRVTVWDSSAGGSLVTWRPPAEELDILAAMLAHSAVCINTASTMTLDGFACGRPVVNVVYDGPVVLPYEHSVRRYYDYHHYRPVKQSGAVDLAGSPDELRRKIEFALDNSRHLAEERTAVLKEFCHRPAQGSVKFIVDRIAALAHRRRAQPKGRAGQNAIH